MWNFILPDGHPFYQERCAFWSYSYHGKGQARGYHLINLSTGEWCVEHTGSL